MSYTVKVTQKTKDLQDLSFRTYDIFDAAGKLAGHAVRRGKDVVFQLIGGPTVKRQASNVERAVNNWAENRAKLGEGDVVKHKFGLKQQQKNKTRYRFYQEIKDDIPVYDRGTHNAVLPKYIESHRHPENLEAFDHFEVRPSVTGTNGRIIGVTHDGLKVGFSSTRLEIAHALADAYNRGGFSDKDLEKVPLEPTESRRPSAALAGIALAENKKEK